MSEAVQKKFSIDIHQKLYEKETPHGDMAVYQTSPFGMILTIDGQIVLSENDGFFYHEMMSHPALFTHPHPQKVAIAGNDYGILQEILKHSTVKEVLCVSDNTALQDVISQYFTCCNEIAHDPRVKYHVANPLTWFAQCEMKDFDIIIQSLHSEDFLQEHYQYYHHALRTDGILVQPCISSLLYPLLLKPIFQHLKLVGFDDRQMLNFPQPSYPSGLRTVMMATKSSTIKRIRERDIYNRTFSTRYYNFDTHKAALALPEFARKDLDIADYLL